MSDAKKASYNFIQEKIASFRQSELHDVAHAWWMETDLFDNGLTDKHHICLKIENDLRKYFEYLKFKNDPNYFQGIEGTRLIMSEADAQIAERKYAAVLAHGAHVPDEYKSSGRLLKKIRVYFQSLWIGSH